MPIFSLGEKRVRLAGTGQYIAYDATLVGDITLHSDVNIWFKAVIRAENDAVIIGERTNVQEGAVLHVDPGFPLTIGANATIGHRAVLHGCTVGDGVLVGINAVVLNGARIGAGTLIGAGALVPEGKEIPPGVLVVGSPGRVLRELKPAEKEMLRHASRIYVERSKYYAATMREQSLETPK